MLAQGADSGGGDSGAADQAKTDSLYENRPASKKIIRVITVMAYMVSVSFVAIVLSGYYVFLWQPPNPRLLHTSKFEGIPGLDYPDNHAPLSPSIESPRHIDERVKFPQNQETNLSDRANLNGDVRTFSTTWNAIFRASVGGKETPSSGNETRDNSVYQTVNNVSTNNGEPVTSSVSFIKNDEINEVANSTSSISSDVPELNKFSEPLTSDDISIDEIDRAANTEDLSATTSTRNQSSTGTRDINNGQIALPIETSENYEDSKYFASGSPPFRQDQTSESMENRSETIQQPNELGSHTARGVPIPRFPTNDSSEEQRQEKNLPVQLSSRDSSVDMSTEDTEALNGELALELSPQIAQPDPKLPDEENAEIKEERLSQEINDFDFI